MTTRKPTEVTFVTSPDFQRDFKQSNYMDNELRISIDNNKDIPAILATRFSARKTLPYGRWTCKDKTEVIFNREYQPIFQRYNGVNAFILPNAWIENIVKTEYFYDDYTTPVKYLLRKFKDQKLDLSESRACRKSLAIVLKILEDYHPENTGNFCQSWKSFKI